MLVHLTHLASDKLLREFGVMARHVRIRVSENLRQHVDRHAVFHGQTGEGVTGAMRCQVLVDIADRCNLFEVCVHLVVARYRQHPSALHARFVVFVFAKQPDGVGQQGNPAHHGGFLSGFVNLQLPVIVCADMFRAQVVGVGER